MKTSAMLTFLLLAAGASSAQNRFICSGLSREFVAVKGAPYSAEEIQESVLTQRDGSHFVVRQSCKLFRDGQGRERIEQLMPTSPTGTPDTPAEELVIEISDPVGGFRYSLATETKLARRYSLSAPTNMVLPHKSAPGAKTVTQSLGTRSIEGVSAEGQLETTTIPVENKIETWRSPELKIVLLAKSGDQETHITNLRRAEPSPDLFRVPSEYTLVEFSIPFGAPAPSVVGTTSALVAISQAKPEYTSAARARGIQGSVTLTLTIGTDGFPRDVRVVRRLGLDPGLDQKAIEAVRKWRFRSGPVAVHAITEVNFKL